MPTLTLSGADLSQVGVTLILGLTYIYLVAWRKRKASWRLDTFFLGGRNIGAPLTAQTYWSSSFSFAGGILYFAALGNKFGLSVIWFQIPWVIGIWFLAWRLPQLIKITENYTIHGFIGSYFGPTARLLASLVTLTGFMGMFAYEVAISTETVAPMLGVSSGLPVLAVMIGIYVAAHADVGGYSGTAETDRVQNYFGLVALLIVIYYVLAVVDNSVVRNNLTLDRMTESFLNVADVPWPFWIGVVCFAPFFNIVDMSHWQAIAANSGDKLDIQELQRAIRRSSIWMLVFPAAGGAFLGYAWKGVSNVTGDNWFAVTLAGLPGHSGELSGFLVGFIVLGVAAMGFSSAAGFLLSSVQTYSWDIRHHKQIFARGARSLSEPEERRIVSQSRATLYIATLSSVVLLLALRHWVGDDAILPLQFVLVGIVVSLFPATAYALWLNGRMKPRPSAGASRLIVLSIPAGYLAGASTYFKPLVFGGDLSEVYQWAPVASLALSSVLVVIACVHDWLVDNPKIEAVKDVQP